MEVNMNLGRENETLEFKESTAEFDKACRAIVGMLNKSGFGTIYFGVKDNGDVKGLIIGKDTLSTLTDRIKDSIKPSIYPLLKEEKYDDKSVIKLTFRGSNRPYAYKGSFFIRVEQQNLPIDPLVIRELIKTSQEYNDNWEKEITKYGVEFVDEESLDLFYKQAVSIGRINKYDHTSEELLTQLGLLINGKLTNAGYYLFGKNVSLVYKAVVYPTKDRINPIDLKRYEDNIFNLINQVIGFINEKMNWKVEINNLQRLEIPEIPVVAIREIVINSLVHSDFYGDSEHQVTFDPECVEIYNPGDFGEYTPFDYINQTLPSRTRHKIIQGILYKAFDIETLGRGLKRTDLFCKEAKIKWDYIKYPFGFSFKFYRKKADSDDDLSLKAKQILDYMNQKDGILNNIVEASEVIGQKERSTYSYLNELVEKDKIIRIGSRKSGYWKVIK